MSGDETASLKRQLEDCGGGAAEDIPVSSPKRKKCGDAAALDSAKPESFDSLVGNSGPSGEQFEDNASETKEDSIKDGGLREKDVGITEYISTHPGFSAVLKERYSDFLVYEIDLEGNVVRLTDTEAPEEGETANQVTDIISAGDIELLKKLADGGGTSQSVSIEVTNKDKNARRQVHEAIRQNFLGLESTTESRDGSTVIVVKKVNGKVRKTRQQWPASRGNYTHFVLYKENRDTQDAISAVASILRLPPKSFSYAGTKDKRAKTTQIVSGYRVSPKTLLFINEKSKFMKVGNIKYKDQPVKLGDLSGNKFVIILRRLQGTLEEVQQAMCSLELKGFINYYGMQRFGTTCIPTHHIGRALLQSRWKEAIDLILQPRKGEDANLSAARQIWQRTKDAHKAYASLNHKNGVEGRLLCGLKSHGPKDFVNALNALPRNIRLMYVHSYQSYIWNKVVSKRIRTYGLKVLEGDLVLSSSINNDYDEIVLEDTGSLEMPKISTKYVTKEDIENIAITDVVLPLPGRSILYPKNKTAEWYKEFLEEDGMDMNSFTSRVKTYSLGGSYRKMIVKLNELKWEIIPYDDVCQPLVLSDCDLLNRICLPPPEEGGQHKALKLEFHLQSSCYATMAVREILKIDTSVSAQKILSTS